MKKIFFTLIFLLQSILVFSQSLEGRTFWLGLIENTGVPEIKLFISTRSATPVNVQIIRYNTPTGTLDATVSVSSAAVQTVTLNTANVIPTAPETTEGRGILIIATDDVSVFATSADANSMDGTALIPSSNFGKTSEYYIASYPGDAANPSQFTIVATEDNTEIKITPTAATTGGLMTVGSQYTVPVLLSRGQIYSVKAVGAGDLTGTLVTSCQPVAVFSGTKFASVANVAGCTQGNHLFEQMQPVGIWGQRFLAIPLETSTAEYVLRFLASDDNTVVSIDSAVTGANIFTLNKGQYIDKAFQKPVTIQASGGLLSVIQYMKSNDCNNVSPVQSNPSMLMLPSVERSGVRSATFTPPTRTGINSHTIGVYVKSTSTNATTFNMQLNGVPVTATFTVFNPGRDYVFARIPIPLATASTYTLTANADFTAIVYGFSNTESYLYSGAAAFATSTSSSLTAATPYCPNIPISFTATGRNIVKFDWYLTGDGTTLSPSNTATPVLQTTNIVSNSYPNGTYTIRVILTNSAGCKDTVETSVTVALPTPAFSNPYSLCKGDSAVLDPGVFTKYLWSNGATTRTITIRNAGTYWVELTAGTCTQRTNVVVNFVDPPTINFSSSPAAPSYTTRQGAKVAYVCEANGESFVLAALNPYSGETVVWTTSSGTQTGNTIVVTKAGTYKATVTNLSKCTKSDSIVFKNACETLLQLPTAFTPNDDGNNDVLDIFGDGFYSLDLRIYNRWGETVFNAKDEFDRWNGTFANNGRQVPAGTYVWVATYESVYFPGQTQRAEGKINLIR